MRNKWAWTARKDDTRESHYSGTLVAKKKVKKLVNYWKWSRWSLTPVKFSFAYGRCVSLKDAWIEHTRFRRKSRLCPTNIHYVVPLASFLLLCATTGSHINLIARTGFVTGGHYGLSTAGDKRHFVSLLCVVPLRACVHVHLYTFSSPLCPLNDPVRDLIWISESQPASQLCIA